MSLTALLVVLAAQTPLADDPTFKAGVAAYDDIEYEDAIKRFESASTNTSLSDADRATVLVWLGVAHGQLGKFEAAKAAFDAAMALDSDANIQTTLPPKVQEVLDASRAEAKQRTAVVEPPPPPPPPPSAKPLPWMLIAGGSTMAVGGVLVVAGVAAVGVSALTASGIDNREEFQDVIIKKRDDANVQLAVGYVLLGVGGAALAGGGALLALGFME